MNVATTSFAGPTQLVLEFVPGLTDILGPKGPGNLKIAVPDPPPPAPAPAPQFDPLPPPPPPRLASPGCPAVGAVGTLSAPPNVLA